MSDQDAFGRILESLYEAMLDDSHWPATSALIDEACGIVGNSVAVGEGPKDDIRIFCAGLYYRGQRRLDLEREYLEDFHPIDERIPRLRQLPEGRLVRIRDLYTAEELKTSSAYNEAMVRGTYQNGLNLRLDVTDGSYLTWNLGDRVGSEGVGVFRDHQGHAVAASHPTVCPRPAGAGPGRGPGYDRDRPARQSSDRRPSPGPAGADHGGQRLCPQHPPTGRGSV